MNLREAAQQALDFIVDSNKNSSFWLVPASNLNKTVATLRAALSDTQDWNEIEALRESLREHMAEIHRLRAAGRQALETLEAPWAAKPGGMLLAINTLRAALEPVTDCHEKEGDKLAPPLDHIPDADKMVASVRESRTVEPVAYVTGYSKGYATVRPVDPCLLMCVGMALYRSPPTISKTETVEPVAWMWDYRQLDGHVITKVIFAKHYKHSPGDLAYVLEGKDAKPLYTAPPKREPLTDEEIQKCVGEVDDARLAGPITKLIRAVERAHGIGGEE